MGAHKVSLAGFKALAEQRGYKVNDLVRDLGIKKSTVRALLQDKWTKVDRKVLERMIDLFGCTVSDLFAITESAFFRAFAGSCCCLAVGPEHRDNESIQQMADFLQGNGVEFFQNRGHRDVRDARAELGLHEDSSLEQILNVASCVVFGSPVSNPLAEEALIAMFGKEKPFLFVDPRQHPFSSSFVQAKAEGTKMKYGIVVQKEKEEVESEVKPGEEFWRRSLEQKDAGLVSVKNVRLPSGVVRKLIVVAGITRIGTQGAADAVVKLYRDLEPVGSDDVVWGIVKAKSSKLTNSSDRKYEGYKAAYGLGGNGKRKKPPGSAGGPASKGERAG